MVQQHRSVATPAHYHLSEAVTEGWTTSGSGTSSGSKRFLKVSPGFGDSTRANISCLCEVGWDGMIVSDGGVGCAPNSKARRSGGRQDACGTAAGDACA